MPQCPFCHRDNPAGVEHCQGCGAWLRSDGPSPKIEPEVPAAAAAGGEKASSSPDPLESQLLPLLRAGRKIEAIKLCRQEMGCGLKEAKDYVELLAAKHGIAAKGAGCSSAAVLLFLTTVGLGVACWAMGR